MSPQRKSRSDHVLELVKSAGVLRPRDLDRHGIPRQYLSILHRRGLVERVGRGLYVATGAWPSANRSLAEVCKRIPRGVVCLLSALRFHGLTTQSPFEVWLALPEKAWKPKVEDLPVRLFRFSGRALTEGIEEHNVEGVAVRVYCPAKTVADCFKYRNKIGLDVALEALRDAKFQRKCSNDDLWCYAKICRVANVMRPYLEAMS